MIRSLKQAASDLEQKAQAAAVTEDQLAIVRALREVGATAAAEAVEELLLRHQRAVEEGLADAEYVRTHAAAK